MAKQRLLDQVRDKIRTLHYSIRTEQAYISWIKRFILFNNKKQKKTKGVKPILRKQKGSSRFYNVKLLFQPLYFFFPKPENQTEHHPPGVML